MSYLDRTDSDRIRSTAFDNAVNAFSTVACLIAAVFFTGLLASFVLMHLSHDPSRLGTAVYAAVILWTLGFGIAGLFIASYQSWLAWQNREPPFWRSY